MPRRAFCVTFLTAVFVMAALHASAQDQSKSLPEGKGKDYVATVCQQCHGLENVIGAQHGLDEWRSIVNEMVSNGAQMDDQEVEIVAQYLARNFGPPAAGKTNQPADKSAAQPKVNVNKSSAKDLESGLQLSEKDAEAIVAYREKNGNFSNVDDLKKVAGLDPKKIDAAKDRLEF